MSYLSALRKSPDKVRLALRNRLAIVVKPYLPNEANLLRGRKICCIAGAGTRTPDTRIMIPLLSVLSDVGIMHYDAPRSWLHSWLHQILAVW